MQLAAIRKLPETGDYLVRGRWCGRGPALDLQIHAGRVKAVAPAGKGKADLGSPDHVLVPPLLDIQVNGADGIDLQDPTLDAEALWRITRFLAARGVGRWVPTLVTMPLDAMEHACRVIAASIATDKALAKAIPGIHLEGPFISPMDGPRGAHPLAHVRPPDWPAFSRMLRAADGRILYTTLAPDVPGAVPFIRRAVATGVRVSLGHHNANAAQIRTAADAGATLCTHLGNGMLPVVPRHLNPLWPQLDDKRLAASFIADLHHLPPEVLRVLIRAKGPARSILTSDCTHLAGLRPGVYNNFGGTVELGKDGAIRIPGTPLLAGSANLLDTCLCRCVEAGALTWPQAIASATSIPARLLGLPNGISKPKAGSAATLAIVTL